MTESLDSSLFKVELVRDSEGMHRTLDAFKENKHDLAIFHSMENRLEDMRYLSHFCQFQGDVIFPWDKTIVWPRAPFEDPTPIFAYFYPMAGTGRFGPPFQFLMEKLALSGSWPATLHRNSRYFYQYKDSTPPQNDIDSLIH